jgi:hypothetical protein
MRQKCLLVLVGFLLGWAACWCKLFFSAIRGADIFRYANLVGYELALYRQMFGKFPEGSNADIGNALNGQNPSNSVFILSSSPLLNDKHEIIDPWGTPYRIYFSPVYGSVVWSAGIFGKFDCRRSDNHFYAFGIAPSNSVVEPSPAQSTSSDSRNR